MASASFQYQIRFLRCSSTVGKFVHSNDLGIAVGFDPIISSKRVNFQSVCRLLLCVNSSVGKALSQSSGCAMQYIDKYASMS